jgi:UDP-N-acetylglucosamine 3-dehydrogenase
VIRLRVGILGFGYTGRLHLRAWQQTAGAEVIAVADNSPQTRAQIPAPAAALASCDELLAMRPDAVSICLPTSLHHRATLDALAAGSHVFLEKPIAVSTEQACEMIAAASSTRRTLFVGMTHRFYPEILAAKTLVDDGAVGDIVLIRDCILEHFGFLDSPRWYLDPYAAGGGTVLSSGIHLVDRVLWFAQEMPEAVTAAGGNPFLNQGVEDAAQMFLRFPSGRSAQLSFGLLAEPHPLVCDLELIGTRGSIVVHTWSGYEVRTTRGVERHDVYRDEPHADKVVAGIRGEVAEFCSAIQEGREPNPSVEESTRALRVIEAAYRSMRTRNTEPVI